MMRTLLVRGLIAGLVAGIAAFLFAFFIGEPHVDAAIAIEEAAAQGHDHGAEAGAEEELVSRDVQSTIGLFVAEVAPATAIGGLFAVAFALVYGRFGRASARAQASLLAVGGFVAIALVPFLKYPANPPAVGNPDTIVDRTLSYFVLLGVSVLAAVLAVYGARRLNERFDGWTSALLGAGGYLVVVVLAGVLLPTVSEVTRDFPATLMWEFRLASIGNLAVLWVTLGVVFGALAQRVIVTATEQRETISV